MLVSPPMWINVFFAATRIKILGHIVDNGRICPDDEKVKVIENWKPPKNKTQLRTFLGMLNFFSQYIRNYAQIAAPLTTMLARNKPDKLIWTDTEQRAFDLLKAALVSKPILRPVDMSKDFHLFCDASLNALGCALMQYDEEANNYYVIEYASKKLLPNEKNYSIIELELYSLVYGLKKFHHYTYNSKVHVCPL